MHSCILAEIGAAPRLGVDESIHLEIRTLSLVSGLAPFNSIMYPLDGSISRVPLRRTHQRHDFPPRRSLLEAQVISRGGVPITPLVLMQGRPRDETDPIVRIRYLLFFWKGVLATIGLWIALWRPR